MTDLIVNEDGPVLSLTLNRPKALNAFSAEMVEGLTASFRDAKKRNDVRVVVMSGAGKSFSAGGDVKTMGEASAAQVYDHVGKLNECILAMRELEKPVIAAVRGFAAGAGFNLALACDLIVAAQDSRFVLSFTQVGLISDGGGSYFLPRLIGPHLAKEWFFLAEPIPAARAHELGLVNRLVPADDLEEEAMRLARRLAAGPAKAYGMMKRIVDSSLNSTLDEILQAERIAQTMMVATEDHLEGVQAFREKRAPQFHGR
ncbi:MAG: enoyl-CoA hydratase/isomerase family protein [Bacilli bacterium]